MCFARHSALLAVVLAGSGLARGDSGAVLPFANRTPNPPQAVNPSQTNMDWIGESIAETVRDALGSHGVVSIGREETNEAYQRLNLQPRAALTVASVLKIGESLDAEQVVYGSFEFVPDAVIPDGRGTAAADSQSAPGTLKISARIFDRRRMKEGLEFFETGNLDDLATLEAHLAWRTLSLVAPRIAPPESDFRLLRPPVRLDAEENYVRGLLAATPDQSEKFYLQAVRLDARATHATYLLGRIHYDRKEYRQAADWLEKIPPEDVHFRDVSFLLGLALFQLGDYAGAQKSFQAVADSVPLGEVLNNLGAAESRRNLPQAADAFRKALEDDGNDPVYHFNLGYALWKKGDFTDAAERFRAVLARQPEDQFATLLLGMCLKKQGPRTGDARLETLERLKTNYEERAYWQLKALVDPAAPPAK